MFKDFPLSNFDLIDWCKFLKIPIKGIISRNGKKPLLHSPCAINMNDFGSMGTHWVCCWRAKKANMNTLTLSVYPRQMSGRAFSVMTTSYSGLGACGADIIACFFFNERNRRRSLKDILDMFSDNVHKNERIVKSDFAYVYNNGSVLRKIQTQDSKRRWHWKDCFDERQPQNAQGQVRSLRYHKNSVFTRKLAGPSRAEGSGILSGVADTGLELFISKGIPYLAKKGVEAVRYYASETMRDPALEKKATNYGMRKA